MLKRPFSRMGGRRWPEGPDEGGTSRLRAAFYFTLRPLIRQLLAG
jgi:hypothetical protein